MLRHPLHIYINWSAYDELSDKVPLTEDLAMAQFEHLLRLRRQGVRLDAYLMDCFWYEPASAYRTFRRPHWRDDGERWLAACRQHVVLPGLWFACNTAGAFAGLAPSPRWRGSIDPGCDARWASACLFEGPFLDDLMAAFHLWYERGVRVFKLDFLNLQAHLPHHRLTLLASEIRERNAGAFLSALHRFRIEHPEAVLIAYNGFEEDGIQGGTDFQPRKTLDHRWLEAVDAFYCGDPRPADVPAVNFWRSKDVYTDHMVRAYLAQGFRAQVIDNAGFMIGTTGTCYHRGKQAWKGMLLLALARGGWATTYYGNLDLLEEADARWFATAQRLLAPLVHRGDHAVLGGMPGAAEPYGYLLRAGAEAGEGDGAVLVAVKPSQPLRQLARPPGTVLDGEPWRLLFQDQGPAPALLQTPAGAEARMSLSLSAEQMAVVGLGRFADPAWALGVQADVRCPERIARMEVVAQPDGRNRLRGSCLAPVAGKLRVIARQRANGKAKRSTGGAPPEGVTLGKLLSLQVRQGGRELPLAIAYDHAIWSGLSWAAGEISASALTPGEAVELGVISQESEAMELTLEAYAVDPAPPTGA